MYKVIASFQFQYGLIKRITRQHLKEVFGDFNSNMV